MVEREYDSAGKKSYSGTIIQVLGKDSESKKYVLKLDKPVKWERAEDAYRFQTFVITSQDFEPYLKNKKLELRPGNKLRVPWSLLEYIANRFIEERNDAGIAKQKTKTPLDELAEIAKASKI